MQRIATRVFIYSSIAFGIIGITVILTSSWEPNTPDTALLKILMKLLMASIFVLLPSFALSIASKYLNK